MAGFGQKRNYHHPELTWCSEDRRQSSTPERPDGHRRHSSPKIRFAPDSPLEGSGFEPSVPLRECRRSEPLAGKETSGVGNGVSSTAGPMVRIRFPPATSHSLQANFCGSRQRKRGEGREGWPGSGRRFTPEVAASMPHDKRAEDHRFTIDPSPSHVSSHAETAAKHPRWEPDAGMPHLPFCAGAPSNGHPYRNRR